MEKADNKGTLVISLDLELMWGVIDKATVTGYGESNVANVDMVLSKMLHLFDRYNIHATFAPVGFIAYSGKESLLRNLPEKRPSYHNKKLSPYANHYIDNIDEAHADLYFAPHLIERIRRTPGMELGTHTFCHYYCIEEGQTLDEFREDLQKAILTANKNGYDAKSIIFPRNQVTTEYLQACKEMNIKIYRGNPSRFFIPGKKGFSAVVQRACRFLDSCINISGHNTYVYRECVDDNGMVNVKASRFLYPYKKSSPLLTALRLRRIKKDIAYAAKHGEMYHLWWHPHNFGADVQESLDMLESILRYFDSCRKKYGMTSVNMLEYVNRS
jgi:peptidoglycan/xylan/chitin deacetylase (PgdA/CDA1 family)